MKKDKTSLKSSFLLFLAAAIWGVAFVAQSVGMDYMGPCTFNGVRFLIGGTVLLPFIWYREKKNRKSDPSRQKSGDRKSMLTGGICCGLALCIASLLQQFGIQYTTVGKAGFITTLYIIIVPFLGIFLRKKIGAKVWIGAVIAVAGMYLLCMSESFSLSRGDALVLACAVVFSVHILVVDYFSPKMDSVKLSCMQFYTSGIICTVLAFLTETPSLDAVVAGAVPVLYAGVLSCGVAYTLQVVGQKNVEPTVAALLLSMESVVSVLAGWALLNQKLSIRELSGCVLVFAAVILVQLPDKMSAKGDKK
ncbi:MAG: DMT family transporter [Lachnospiraceae bacterium]|nr:DMT family transporter [Lachnospiraceae bacterium]